MDGEGPLSMECPTCHQRVSTRVDVVPGTLTWIVAIVLCLFGCVLGCCLIPFCVTQLQDIQHFCPLCKALVGRYRRGSRSYSPVIAKAAT